MYRKFLVYFNGLEFQMISQVALTDSVTCQCIGLDHLPNFRVKPSGVKRPTGGNIEASDYNLNEIAYRAIKDDIISCALQPGSDVSEATLLARYGFSKAPIRSALVRLRQESLVVSRGRRGNLVSQITFRDVQEIFQLRLLLEVVATKLAAGKVDAEHIRSLNNAVIAGFKAGDKQSEANYVRANREFHRYVAEASGNQRLAALVVDLMEQHERIVHLGLALQNREREFLHLHDDLVNALIEGNGNRAAELVEQSLRGGQRKVMEVLLLPTNDVLAPDVSIGFD